MKIFEKILCPVDFSENSVKALQWTEYLAQKFQSEVLILFVMETVTPFVDLGAFDYERYQSLVVHDLNEFVAPIRVPYEKMISTGKPAQKIVALAEGLRASLIVLGTRGILGVTHKLLGSTTEAVMRNSSVPVLTISPHCSAPKEASHVLVPLASIHRPPRDFIRLRKILRELRCKPTFFHVVDFQDQMFDASFNANPFLVTTFETNEKTEQLSRIGSMIQRNGNGAEAMIQFGNAANECVKELETRKYDYVLLGVRKKNLLTRFMESNAYKIISQSPVPAITIKTE